MTAASPVIRVGLGTGRVNDYPVTYIAKPLYTIFILYIQPCFSYDWLELETVMLGL